MYRESIGSNPAAVARRFRVGKTDVAGLVVMVFGFALFAAIAAGIWVWRQRSVVPAPPIMATPAPVPHDDQPRPSPPAATVILPSRAVGGTVEQFQEEAKQVVADLRDSYPDLPEALHVAALFHSQLHESAQAEELWQRCLELDPNNVNYYVNYAAIAMDRGNTELAARVLQQALEHGCVSPDVYHHLSLALNQLGRCEEAEKIAKTGVAAYPQVAACWLILGRAQLSLRKWDEAAQNLERALELGSRPSTTYYSLSTAYARLGDKEKAEKYRELFTESRAQQPVSGMQRFQVLSLSKARAGTVTILCESGMVYAMQKDFLPAERNLLRALALEPSSLPACRSLSFLYEQADRKADQRVVLERLIGLEPNDINHFLKLAKLSSELGETERAEAVLKLALALHPGQVVAHTALAEFYLESGRAREARWYAEQVVKRHPSAEGFRFLASACRVLGDQAGAEAADEQARRLLSSSGTTGP